MRYEDWDVLLFPTGRDSKVPLKEFKVACHVVPDIEFSHTHGSHGVPVMTCFVPALRAGAPFHISIHSWRNPEVSQFTRTYSKHVELVKFEARILIDGCMVSSTAVDREGQWPHLIDSTFELNKNGELEPLRFPHFRRELLYQNHWNPGDNIGRVKIIISEGFPRDSLSVPIERVKNIVAFSFQHAPLDLLESNSIAWPNPSMWRRPLNSMPVPTYHPDEGPNSHSHSPRRWSHILRNTRNAHNPNQAPQGFQVPITLGMASSHSVEFQSSPGPDAIFPQNNMSAETHSANTSGSSIPDPYLEPVAYYEWLNSFGSVVNSDVSGNSCWPINPRNASKQSNSDASMPDYMSLHGRQNTMSDPMHISGMSMEDDCGTGTLKVPTNTPIAGSADRDNSSNMASISFSNKSAIPADLATSLTQSLLNQPLPLPTQTVGIPLPAVEIKSRKENRLLNVELSNPSLASSGPRGDHAESHKFSEPAPGLVATGFSTGLLASSGTNPSTASSASSQALFSASVSRNASTSEFGKIITNLIPEALPQPIGMGKPTSNPPGGSTPGHNGGSDKGSSVKRARIFTPASARAIDEEDEPRRGSPLACAVTAAQAVEAQE